MVARICCLALAMGILVGCYDLPRPECGFACGPASECPSEYSCNTAVNRCQLNGTTPTCAAAIDAGMDTPDTPDDLTPPTVTGMVPSVNAVGVPLTTAITAQFSEPVLGVSNLTMTVDRGGIQISGNVTYDGATQTATFQPFSLLMPSTVYTVLVRDDIIDLADNPLATSIAWQFTTAADVTPPTVTTRSPGSNATGVAVGASVLVDFSETVMGVSNTSVTLTDGVTPVPATVSYSISPSRATLRPTTQLAANTTYTVDVTAAIADTAANPLAPVTWMFTTGDDAQSPIVVTRTPSAARVGVPVTTTVTASFDETVLAVSTTSFTLTPMGGSPIAATVGYASPTRTATLTPDLQLAANTVYTVDLTSAITDAAVNALSSVSWTFTTGADTIGPRIAQTTPADLATAVPTTATIAVRFDEPVQNVTITSFTVNAGAITGTIVLSAGDTIATFTPDAALPAGATITVDLTTAITDALANALAAQVTFSFMTAP